jgi:hypothetical protein
MQDCGADDTVEARTFAGAFRDLEADGIPSGDPFPVLPVNPGTAWWCSQSRADYALAEISRQTWKVTGNFNQRRRVCIRNRFRKH